MLERRISNQSYVGSVDRSSTGAFFFVYNEDVLYDTRILSRTRMRRPIRVWDVPYAYGMVWLSHTCVPYVYGMVWLSHTRMGVPYAYGIEIADLRAT